MTAGCDAGGGTETALPPGEPTNAPPGNLVLYASMFDADRVVGYRLGTDGLMPREPFTSIDLQEPRTIVLDGNILYVLLDDRIVALTLAADGSLPRFLTSQTAPVQDA